MAEMTNVKLLNVPLEKDYAHTLYFSSASNQYNYFVGRAKRSYDNMSYQRKDNALRVEEHIDNLIAAGVNYVMYKNPSYSGKWFYAFVDRMEYANPSTTLVYIKTDVLQTWMFEMDVLPSFVEREHSATDIFGEHTIDEGLETGEYVVNERFSFTYGSDPVIVVAVAKNAEGQRETGYLYHGVYSGLRYYCFKSTDSTGINEFLSKYDEEGIGEDVVCMFLAPQPLVSKEGVVSWSQPVPESKTPDKTYINKVTGQTDGREVVKEFSRTYLDNFYTPRNNKLMCYPYRYLMVTNNAGASAVYHFEKFFKDTPTAAGEPRTRTQLEPSFTVNGVLCPGCSISMYPAYYNGAERNFSEGITMGKFPILNWTSDAYTNWLTQNSVNIALQVASGVGQIVAGAAIAAGSGGLATAVGGGSIVGGVTTIANTLAQTHQQSFAPEQIKGNLNSGDVITAMQQNTFHFYVMSVKNEYAEQIDGFFDMFGYKCHKVKVPAKNHRPVWWYTKTVDANITGPIPQENLQEIKDCYNRGLTFWKSASTFRDYSQDNRVST